VTWEFSGTVQPPPGGRGAVFVLGTTEDGSQSVSSDPVAIAYDGTWVAVVGPISRDLAWKMKWIAAYGVMRPGDPYGAKPRTKQPPRAVEPRPPRPNIPQPQVSEPGDDYKRVAVTDIPQKMLPPPTP
jgi:hypothetical protein